MAARETVATRAGAVASATVVAQVLALVAAERLVGLGSPGWAAGLLAGTATAAGFGTGLVRRGLRPSPADRVTLTRAVLAGVVAALVADSVAGPGPGADLGDRVTALLVALTSVALALDWVDGQVARRTGWVTDLGARFDMEVDAGLIAVLSLQVAGLLGPWVLVIGLARYLRLLAALPCRFLRGTAPPRYWAKVVAAVQGVVLLVVSAGVLPEPLAVASVLAALALLAESFAREASWLWVHRLADRRAGEDTEAVSA